MTQLFTPLHPATNGALPPAAPIAEQRPRLILVGESERSAPPSDQTEAGYGAGGPQYVCINGHWHAVRHRTLSFVQILAFVMPDFQERGLKDATVTFRRGSAERPVGLLQRGDTVPVVEGMLFSASVTVAS